jgi:hypothetical protein
VSLHPNRDGARIAGATITISSSASGNRAATSNVDGTYQIDSLPTASYSVNIQATGFDVFTQANVSVTNAQTSTLDVVLTPPAPIEVSHNADLTNLSLSNSSLSPGFSNSTTWNI